METLSKEEKKNKSPVKKAVEKKAVKPKKKKIRKRSPKLVPPPPPTIPSIVSKENGAYVSSIPVDYMSLKDLKWKKSVLTKQLEAYKMDEEDSLKAQEESARRAETFIGLYEEGVVSKKELEAAKRKAKRLAREVELDQLKLEGLNRSLNAVNNRIEYLEKAKSKKSKTKKRRKKSKSKKTR